MPCLIFSFHFKIEKSFLRCLQECNRNMRSFSKDEDDEKEKEKEDEKDTDWTFTKSGSSTAENIKADSFVPVHDQLLSRLIEFKDLYKDAYGCGWNLEWTQRVAYQDFLESITEMIIKTCKTLVFDLVKPLVNSSLVDPSVDSVEPSAEPPTPDDRFLKRLVVAHFLAPYLTDEIRKLKQSLSLQAAQSEQGAQGASQGLITEKAAAAATNPFKNIRCLSEKKFDACWGTELGQRLLTQEIYETKQQGRSTRIQYSYRAIGITKSSKTLVQTG